MKQTINELILAKKIKFEVSNNEFSLILPRDCLILPQVLIKPDGLYLTIIYDFYKDYPKKQVSRKFYLLKESKATEDKYASYGAKPEQMYFEKLTVNLFNYQFLACFSYQSLDHFLFILPQASGQSTPI